jgi:aminoglycoside phosphotransferase (APT) family kinase protein
VRPNTAFVQTVLHRLEQAGVAWSPRALGVDDEGHEVVSWLDGDTVSTGDDVDLAELTLMVRELHDLTTDLAGGQECVVHDDLQPRNIVIRSGRPVGLIDWEQARPGRRVDDVSSLCWSFTQPCASSDPRSVAKRWRLVVDAYELDDRRTLIPTILERMTTCAVAIERCAAAGSARHRVLLDRGDHEAIREALAWSDRHRAALERLMSV